MATTIAHEEIETIVTSLQQATSAHFFVSHNIVCVRGEKTHNLTVSFWRFMPFSNDMYPQWATFSFTHLFMRTRLISAWTVQNIRLSWACTIWPMPVFKVPCYYNVWLPVGQSRNFFLIDIMHHHVSCVCGIPKGWSEQCGPHRASMVTITASE